MQFPLRISERAPMPKTKTAAAMAAVSVDPSSRLLPDSLPQFRFGLRSGGGMHVDIAVEVQIQLLEHRDEGLDVIVGRLTRCRQREVALEQNLLLRNVRNEQAVGVRRREGMVELNDAGAVRVDPLVSNRLHLCLLRALRQGVGEQRSGSVESLFE